MKITPQQWVNENITVFKNPSTVIAEMLDSMRGSPVPDTWIEEAQAYLKTVKGPDKPSRGYGNPFAVNWSDKDQVISYAKRLGRGMTVTRNEKLNSYNICHTERRDLYSPSIVVFQT